MFIAVSVMIAKRWKQLKCPSTGECLNKMWYIYTIEYYLAKKKKNEVLIQATPWMNLENILLGEISQTQKNK